MGVSEALVSLMCKMYQIDWRSDACRKKMILAGISEKKTQREIGLDMGMCGTHVASLCRDYGIPWVSRKRRTGQRFDSDRVIRAFRGDPTFRVAGERLGVSRQRAEQLRNKLLARTSP